MSRRLLSLFWLCAVLLAGCASAEGAAGGPEAAPTLTPTPDTLGYQAIAPRSCLIADWSAIQSNKNQGDLIAWRPGQHSLAYLAPAATTTWYIGSLMLASGPDFADHTPLAETTLAAGDLTWSPDGARLAFLAFRVDESLETVMVVAPGEGPPLDLFPLDAARTDARTSQKSILDWRDDHTVRVLTSCGEDCQQQIDFDTRDGRASSAASTQRKNASAELNRAGVKSLDGLEPHQNVLEYDPEQYPRGFSRPNWSPDGRQVVYLDRRGLLWLLNPAEKTQWLLDIGLRVVDETKWSDDGRLLAVRAEDRVYVFEIDCQQLTD